MDVQKIAYDLALVYTKTKFEDALSNGKIPVTMNHPQILDESDFLARTFSNMYLEFLNSPGLFADIQEWEPKLLDNNE